jgi:hypothetical protein
MKQKKRTIIFTCLIILLLTINLTGVLGKQATLFTMDNLDSAKTRSDLTVSIIKPKPNTLYLMDRELTSLPFGGTRVLGKITIEINATDTSVPLAYVDILVDGRFKARLPSGPYYAWMLDAPSWGKHTVSAVAYNSAGDNASASCTFAILSLGRLPKAPSTPGLGTPTQSNTDGYNYYRNKNGVGDFVYNQLWYFNFLDDQGTSDPTDDVAGVAAYGLANPENKLSGGGLTDAFGMIIRDPADGSSFPLFSPDYDPANFTASETFEPGPGPEFQNPGGTIDVITKDHYHITGDVMQGEDKEIRWDLHYRRTLGQPWLPWVHWPVPNTLGVIPAWITYHMQMANAVVNGTFYVRDGTNETTYSLVNVKGYHDGFYSEFVFSIFEWNWLDFKQQNLSVQLLYPHAPVYSCRGGWETCTPGNLRVVSNTIGEQKEYNFYRGCDYDKDEITIVYGTLAVDPRYPDVQYPTEVSITADDGEGNILKLNWSLLRYMIVYFDVPAPFYDTVTFEIIADFHGTFHEASSNITVPIAGTGWSDWSGQAFPQQ